MACGFGEVGFMVSLRTVDWAAGVVHSVGIEGKSIAGNMLGDRTRRRVDVYVPAGHDGSGLPLLVDFAGFTSTSLAHTGWRNYGENLPERLDRLIGSGVMKPVVMAFPDCFTRLGGNQYIDSDAMGNWEQFLIEDMLPVIERQFSCGGKGRRGVFGKSSGGYGAIVHGMRHGGDVWSAIGCHSGDMNFSLMYSNEFCETLRTLDKHGQSIETFIRYFEKGPKPTGSDWHALMILAQCATYDPAPDRFLGIRLPVTEDTCELIPERWENWLKWDPLVMAQGAGHLERLRQLKCLFIDCGTFDQYNLIYGARIMHRKLSQAGIEHVYEEFPDNHSSLDYRLDRSLPLLAAALS